MSNERKKIPVTVGFMYSRILDKYTLNAVKDKIFFFLMFVPEKQPSGTKKTI